MFTSLCLSCAQKLDFLQILFNVFFHHDYVKSLGFYQIITGGNLLRKAHVTYLPYAPVGEYSKDTDSESTL